MRWEELDAVCRCVAAQHPVDPMLAHPGIPLLLLLSFAPITAEDDERAVRAVVDDAWRRTGIFSESEIKGILAETCGEYGEEIRWRWNEHRGTWTAEGEFPCSLRVADYDEFPFAQLEELLQQARRCAAS